MTQTVEINRIQALMEKVNAKNPHRDKAAAPPPTLYEEDDANLPVSRTGAAVSDALIDRQASSSSQLDSIQAILNRLEYNFLPSTFFCLEKQRPFHRIVGTAKEILQVSLPIRCLEATFLALYLSCPMKDVERFPISFKSRAGGQSYRHIVLAVKHRGMYGALGLSRSALLMNKPVTFKSITALLEAYCQCYRQVGHQLVSLKLGLFATHDPYSRVVPCWRFVSLSPQQPLSSIYDCLKTTTTVEHYELLLPVLSDQYLKQGGVPMHCDSGMLVPLASPMLPSPVQQLPDAPFGASFKPPGTVAEEAEDASDSEENQRRVACLVAMTSPFASDTPNGLNSTLSSGGKFTSRLRRAVHDNPYASTNGGGGQMQRSRTVPARHPRPAVAIPPRPPTETESTPSPQDGPQASAKPSTVSDAGGADASLFLSKLDLEMPPPSVNTYKPKSKTSRAEGEPSASMKRGYASTTATTSRSQGQQRSDGLTQSRRSTKSDKGPMEAVHPLL